MVCRRKADSKSQVEVDSHEGGEDHDLEENSEAIKVVRPKFNKAMFPNAIFRDGCMN